MKELILGNITGRKSENYVPLGPWCFSSYGDQSFSWESRYNFPIIFDDLPTKEAYYKYCRNIIAVILPRIISRYKNIHGEILYELDENHLGYFLLPHLIRTVFWAIGRKLYIKKFLDINRQDNYEVFSPKHPSFSNNEECFFYYDIDFQAWLNFMIINHLKPKNVLINKGFETFSKISINEINTNTKIEDPTRFNSACSFAERLVLNHLLRIKNFRHINRNIIQPLQIYLDKSGSSEKNIGSKHTDTSTIFKGEFKKDINSNNFNGEGLEKQMNSNDLALVENIFFLSLPNSMSSELKKTKQYALEKINSYKRKITNKLLIDQVSIHCDKKRLFHAYWHQRGGCLGHVQHGAIYEGIINHCVSDCFELLADYFVSWGWDKSRGHKKLGHIIPLPSLYLSKIRNKHRKENNLILYACAPVNTAYDGICYLEPRQSIQYLKNKVAFFRNLPSEVLTLIKYKKFPYRAPSFLDEEAYLKKNGYNLEYINGNLLSIALKSKLVILDYYGTPFLECLTANIPVIVISSEQQYLFSSSLREHIVAFKKLNVFFDDPEDAAHFLLHNHSNIKEWWWQKDLQEQRKLFCSFYAKTSRFPLIEWVYKIISSRFNKEHE